MITQALLLFLTSWIIENTEFEKKVEDPKFFFLTKEEMSKKACFSSQNCKVQAYYVEDEGIYLINKLNLNKDEFQNLLIQNQSYTLQETKNKLKIDLLWNDLVYYRFNKQIKRVI